MARGKTNKVYLKMYLEESQAERLESVKKLHQSLDWKPIIPMASLNGVRLISLLLI